MIDLDATGPVYRGHKLSRIVEEYGHGYDRGLEDYDWGHDARWLVDRPISTLNWARLDVRVIGNPWGLSVSELP